MLSVLICAKNESRNLLDCIRSVSFADEIVVIDDYSNDGTVELAQGHGCRVIQRRMNGDWSAQRNFGIEQCKGDWVLVLDADERVSAELRNSIIDKLTDSQEKEETFQLRRENCFLHNKATHGVLRSDWVTRLFMKSHAHYEGLVHERVVSDVPVRRIHNGVLYHYSYRNWSSYYLKLNHYTDLLAEQLERDDRRVNFWFDIMFRPWLGFFKMYFLKKGFLDGKMGFILSVNHAFYTFTKYVKLYYLKRNNGEL